MKVFSFQGQFRTSDILLADGSKEQDFISGG